MAEIISQTSVCPNLLPMQGRSPGTHVSTLIHRLALRANLYEPRELNMAKVQLGSSIEWALIQRWKEEYPGEYHEVGELERDGLFGTMDLLEIGTEETGSAVHEMKLTWLSARHDIWSDKLMKFWWQVKAYCFMSGTDVGVLHVWYVNGGGVDKYADGDTEYREWRVQFSEEDLVKNWRMLLREKERYESGLP